MKYTLLKTEDGDKALFCDGDLISTWDKREPYEYCVEQAQSRLRYDDELVEDVVKKIPEKLNAKRAASSTTETVQQTAEAE